MLRTLPPTAAPFSLKDLLFGVMQACSGEELGRRFEQAIRDYFGVRHVFLMCSGKAALFTILRALTRLSDRNEVIAPAYSSFCLASVLSRSGLRVRLCDVDPATLDFDLESMDKMIGPKTLAVIPVHLYGLVGRMNDLRDLAAGHGAFVVEDAAQAAGASFEDKKAGCIGHAGILSLGRGKNVCALEGGVIITNHENLAQVLRKETERIQPESRSADAARLAKGLGMLALIHPNRYRIPASLPFLGLGRNVFHPGFAVRRMSRLNASIGLRTFKTLDELNARRRTNADILRSEFEDCGKWRIPIRNPETQSVDLRFPMIFQDPEDRNRSLGVLSRKGMGASAGYPAPLDRIPEFEVIPAVNGGFTGARYIADRLLTLPTHPFVCSEDIRCMSETLNRNDTNERC